jgi:hypothetical protein
MPYREPTSIEQLEASDRDGGGKHTCVDYLCTQRYVVREQPRTTRIDCCGHAGQALAQSIGLRLMHQATPIPYTPVLWGNGKVEAIERRVIGRSCCHACQNLPGTLPHCQVRTRLCTWFYTCPTNTHTRPCGHVPPPTSSANGSATL